MSQGPGKAGRAGWGRRAGAGPPWALVSRKLPCGPAPLAQEHPQGLQPAHLPNLWVLPPNHPQNPLHLPASSSPTESPQPLSCAAIICFPRPAARILF